MFRSITPDVARPLNRTHPMPRIFLTSLFGSMLPPGKVRGGAITLAILYQMSRIPNHTSGDVNIDTLTPIQTTLALVHWLDFYCLHSPSEYERTGDKQHPPQTFWEKFKWNLDLHCSFRGIGWDWEVKNVPEGAPLKTTKWQFVRSRLLEASLWYLLLDIGHRAIRYSVYATPNHPDLSLDTFPRQLLFTWLPAICGYWGLIMQYSVFSSLAVASGLSSPQEWPPLAGRLKEVYTVRDLWGKFWHQLLRRKLNLPFEIITRFIPIKKGTLLSRYSQLSLAFFFSGLLHFIGALNVPGPNVYPNAMLFHRYFCIQPLAIMFEDFVIHVAKKWGVKRSRRTEFIGRLWTFVWFSYSLRLAALYHYGFGAFEKPSFPSIVDIILGRLGY